MSAGDQCYCSTWHQQTDVTHIGSYGHVGSDGTGSRVVGVLHVAVATGRRELQGVIKIPVVTIFGVSFLVTYFNLGVVLFPQF